MGQFVLRVAPDGAMLCGYCKKPLSIPVHHVPQARGGVVVICTPCNGGRR